jgi:hypothetical protein
VIPTVMSRILRASTAAPTVPPNSAQKPPQTATPQIPNLNKTAKDGQPLTKSSNSHCSSPL